MNSTDQATIPPELKGLIDHLKSQGYDVHDVEVRHLRLDPASPARESTAPFAESLPPPALLQQVNAQLRRQLRAHRERYSEICMLMLAHGFKPGQNLLASLEQVLDHWDTRSFDKAPENPAASGGAPASVGTQPAPPPEIPADRHLRAGFPAFRTADIQNHPFRTLADIGRSVAENLKGTTHRDSTLSVDEWARTQNSPPSQMKPGEKRPANHIIPALCWRYGSTPGELRGYLDREPENTLFIITPQDEGEPGYRLDGITRRDGEKSPCYASIMAAQNDACYQLKEWAIRHFLTRQGSHPETAN